MLTHAPKPNRPRSVASRKCASGRQSLTNQREIEPIAAESAHWSARAQTPAPIAAAAMPRAPEEIAAMSPVLASRSKRICRVSKAACTVPNAERTSGTAARDASGASTGWPKNAAIQGAAATSARAKSRLAIKFHQKIALSSSRLVCWRWTRATVKPDWTNTVARLVKKVSSAMMPKSSGASRRARTTVTVNWTPWRRTISTVLQAPASTALGLVIAFPWIGRI
jgi:hypothetical protein